MTVSHRIVGSGVPVLPWKVTKYSHQYGDYDGHSFITMDPKGVARSVCDGFYDDMAWITDIHNLVIADGWRSRLARRLLGITIIPPLEEPSPNARPTPSAEVRASAAQESSS